MARWAPESVRNVKPAAQSLHRLVQKAPEDVFNISAAFLSFLQRHPWEIQIPTPHHPLPNHKTSQKIVI
jgi:hypothetical protein